ncbi:MAG TPA: hypothetical protein VLV16_01630 [Gemmatimonadales bacterium]|nr:hypothetical protein [Gemmatimonadales bacterium]
MIRGSDNGIRLPAGAVSFMRTARVTLLCALGLLTGRAPLAAQAVDRTDTPPAGAVRVTFDPRITTWDEVYTDAGLARLGAPISGDTVGGAHIPQIARMEQDARTASGVAGFVASLGQGLLSAHQERRVTPITVEVGLTDRLSFAVTVPIVRVATRTSYQLKPAGASLGANPLATTAGADQEYSGFFSQFDNSLVQLADSINTGHYGCPSAPSCATAQALLARGQAVRDALDRTVYGVGTTGSPYMPRSDSDAGVGITNTVSTIQQQLQTTYHVPGFNTTFLLPADTVNADQFASLLNDTTFGFGYLPFRNTWHYGLGDIELKAKYRVVPSSAYAAAFAAIVRLPTATRDSTLEVLDIPIGGHQTALEADVIQELTLFRHLWLNLSVRGGKSTGSTRAARVAPLDAFLVPYQATTVFNWDIGDYVAVDFAPMYKLARQFAVGVTAGYFAKRADRYAYQSTQDSVDVADRLGAPVPASVLAEGTADSWVRVGVAVTYAVPEVEGSFSVEKTVSGAGGQVPDATVFRLVMRVTRKLF